MGDDRHAGPADERAELSEALPAYELGPVLGRGSFAVVYAARHRWLDRDVAVKRLSPDLRLEDEARERFVAEARLLASLDHAHVIRVHDYVESERVCALVMERLRGGTLADRRQVAPPSRTQACAIACATLHGLEHAHQHGILHRDVKPENILFGTGETVRVADFGIAKLVAGERAGRTSTDSILGTPTYMAPEQVDRAIAPLSAATDVWSAAVVLYEMLAGEPPYPRGELAATLMQHMTGDPRHIQTLAPEVPGRLAEVVMKGLVREPGGRWPSALAFADALEAAVGPDAIAATGVPVHRTPPAARPDGNATIVADTVDEAGPTAPPRPEARVPLGPPGERERALLRGQSLFRGVPDSLRDLIIDSFGTARYEAGELILEEGVPTDGLYVILEGRARVARRRAEGGEVGLRVLEAGASFGAPGLVHERPASATVRALDAMLALKLDGAVFKALARMNPEVRALIDAQTRREQLNDFFRMHTAFGDLPAETIEELVGRSHAVRVAPEEVVITEGERAGPMYFVEDGHLRALSTASGSGEHDVGHLRPGDYFGEITAATGEPRRATVRAVSECRLLRLDPPDVRELLDSDPTFRARIEARIAEYRYASVGSMPTDFPEALPADARAQTPVPGTVEVTTREPPSDPRFGRRARIGRLDVVWQVDETDAGAACLAMVCRHFGSAVPLARVRALVGVSTEGTSIGALAAGAERLGLIALTMRSTISDLDGLGLPAIAHCGANNWVVVYRVTGNAVHVADPAHGRRRLSRMQFAEMWTGHVALFAPGDTFAQAARAQTTDPAAELLRPHLAALLTAAAPALLVAALYAALPLLARAAVDDALPDRDRGLLGIVAIALAGGLALTVAASVFQARMTARAVQRVETEVTRAVAGRLLSLPARWFAGRRGRAAEHRLAGARSVSAMVAGLTIRGSVAVASLLVVTGTLVVVDALLAAVFGAVAALHLLALALTGGRLRRAHQATARSRAAREAREIDAVQGIEAVKSAGAEDHLARALASETGGERGVADPTSLSYQGLAGLVAAATAALFVVLGANRVLDGDLTLGGYVAAIALGFLGATSLQGILALWGEYQAGSVTLDQLRDVLGEEPEDRPGLRSVTALEGAIRVENLSFRFRGERSPEVLSGVSFSVAAGATCAIVGRSGSGKSTLARCVAALLEPTGGRITYDGTDMRELRRSDLRTQIGFVPNDAYMFDDTIAANIALGDPDPDPDRIKWAARVAKAHAFVDRLPQRFQTRIGASGVTLSSAQRQRIAIARAVYGRPPVLVFDEVPNGLDPESRHVVQEAMAELLVGRTAFVVAHRIAEVSDADLILVLDDGQLVEQGTHAELIARRGLYHHLAEQQAAADHPDYS